jgi:hypothetical protein
MRKILKRKRSRSERFQGGASRPAPSASTSASAAGDPSASISPATSSPNAPQIIPSTREPEILLTNANSPSTFVPNLNVPVAPCVAGSSTLRVENNPSAAPPDPHDGKNERKPFVRLARDSKDDELNILVYSYVMSDSPSLRLAVQVTCGLAELVQASAHVLINPERLPTVATTFRNPARRQRGFVKSPRRHQLSSPHWSMLLEKAREMLPSRRTP